VAQLITSELHKGYSPLFRGPPDEWKAKIKETLAARLDFTARALEARPHLLGEFTVADAYLFTVLRWSKPVEIDLRRWPALVKYFDRVAARPAVKTALEVEGLTA
jgi:glutathione S-transferase